MKPKPINSTDLITLGSLYNDGYSGPELSKIFSRSTWWIYKHLRLIPEIKIKNVSDAARKHIIYENFFDTIDTEEKSYFLGFLYADGNISDDGSITLSQAEQDSEIVYKFAKLIGKDLPIYIHQDKRPNKQPSHILTIRSKHMASKLLNNGCSPRKTFILKFPSLSNDNLIKHFIRGYFDGDGCLSINKHKRKGRGKDNKNVVVSIKPHHDFTIVSTLEFLWEIEKIIKEKTNVYCRMTKRHKDRDNNNFTLVIGGRRQIQKVLKWLYEDATIFLSRKHNKYLWLSGPNFNKFQVSIEETNG